MLLPKEQGFWVMKSQLGGKINGEIAREEEVSMERSPCGSHKTSFVNSALDMSKMGNLSIEALWRKKATIASSVVFKANIEVTSNTISWP